MEIVTNVKRLQYFCTQLQTKASCVQKNKKTNWLTAIAIYPLYDFPDFCSFFYENNCVPCNPCQLFSRTRYQKYDGWMDGLRDRRMVRQIGRQEGRQADRQIRKCNPHGSMKGWNWKNGGCLVAPISDLDLITRTLEEGDFPQVYLKLRKL